MKSNKNTYTKKPYDQQVNYKETKHGPYWKSSVVSEIEGKGKKLFIGGLSLNTTSNEIHQYFKRFGAIQSIRLVGELNSRPRGYGFVIFLEKQSLEAALACNEHIIEGRIIDCSIALDSEKSQLLDEWPQEKKIHVSNLPIEATKYEIENHFC